MASPTIFPVAGHSIDEYTDTFGAARSGGRSHKGIDIFAETGTPVVAAKGGVVVKAGDSGGLGGIRAWVRDEDGLYHYYAHMGSLSVREGQTVQAGQTLGGVGQSGNAASTPPHLHYSVNPSGHTSEQGALNPYEYLLSGGAREVGGGRLEGTGATSPMATPSTTAGPHATGGQPQTPDERRLREAQLNQGTLESIMASISAAATSGGGRMLDVKAMFGDAFGDAVEQREAA